MHRFLLLILLFSFKTALAGSGTDSSLLLQLSMSDGLPSNNVFSILQDRNGYLWFSTDNGLAKYNGYSFKIFDANAGLPNEIFGMYEDGKRRLWVDYYGYDLVYLKDDRVRRVNFNTRQKQIRSFKAMPQGDKIFFEYSNGKPALMQVDTSDSVRLVYSAPLTFMHPQSPKLLSIVNNTDLMECTISGDSAISRKICTLPLQLAISQGLRRHTFDSGFYAYAPHGKTVHVFNIYNCSYQPIPLSDMGADNDEMIHLPYYTTDGIFVVTNRHLFIFDRLFNFKSKMKLNQIMPGISQVSYYLQDSSGNKWYATTADGVLMQPPTPPLFNNSTALSQLKGSTNVGISATGNSYWWNTKNKLLFSISPSLELRFSKRFSNEDVQSVFEESDTALYITFTQSVHNGAFVYNPVTDAATNIALLKKNFRLTTPGTIGTSDGRTLDTHKHFWLKSLFSFHRYAPNIFYASSRGVGVLKVQITSDSLLLTQHPLDRYPNVMFDSFHNRYWYYNKEKLAILNPQNGATLEMPLHILESLNIRNISQLRVDSFHNIYVLTDRQIIVFNTRLHRFRKIEARVDITNVLMEVRGNTLLIAGKFGIGYARINGPLSLAGFHIVPNIKSRFYNRVYGLKITTDNNIIVTTDASVHTFSVKDLASYFYVGKENNSLMRLVVGFPQQHAVHVNDTFYLPQETETINFDFINFYGSGARKYTYTIEGRPQWQTTEGGEVYVGDIKPARYYQVQCYVQDELWKSNTYTFHIYRLPYWYQTSTWRIVFWIAGSLIFIISVLAIILLTRSIVARANEKKRLLTELELRAIYAQINPHFIFNTLGSALYFISKKQLDEAYLHVNKFSKLLRSYLKSSRYRYITLSEEIEMIRNYIELQQIRFESKFDYIINVENKIAVNSVQIPSLLLQPLVENAINHGLFHLPEGRKGLLSISFSQGANSNELICAIEDNGVGRQKAKEIKRSSDAQYESFGTKLTEELINIFRQYENMNIHLEYFDKPEPETGTIVQLTIKNLKYVA